MEIKIVSNGKASSDSEYVTAVFNLGGADEENAVRTKVLKTGFKGTFVHADERELYVIKESDIEKLEVIAIYSTEYKDTAVYLDVNTNLDLIFLKSINGDVVKDIPRIERIINSYINSAA